MNNLSLLNHYRKPPIVITQNYLNYLTVIYFHYNILILLLLIMNLVIYVK